MRKAVIDIGTNSTRLLIAEKVDNMWQKIDARLSFTRIGEEIGAEQIIKIEPLRRTAECVAEYVKIAKKENCAEIIVSATSAIRDAKNRQEVCEFITQQCGEKLRVLSGEEEAYLSYIGAVGENKDNVAVLDIGGGSTELVYPQKQALHIKSVAVGAVRLKERAELQQNLRQILQELFSAEQNIFKLVAVGGTATTLAALELGMEDYDSEKIQKYPLSRKAVEAWQDKLANMSIDEIKKLKGMPAKRADVIYYGVCILSTIMQIADLDFVWAEDRDLMYGILDN